jgi:hypothetical protein
MVMSAAIRQVVTVRPGGVIEIRSPELKEGDKAEVTVVITNSANGEPDASGKRGWRGFAGAVNSKNTRAGDNQVIDADLAAEYGGQLKPEP